MRKLHADSNQSHFEKKVKLGKDTYTDIIYKLAQSA